MLVLCMSSCGAPEIEVTQPERGQIRESFTEPAKTRLENTYPITMPVSGRIDRIELEPGDPVRAGQQLVKFDRVPLEKAVDRARAQVAELNARIAVNEHKSIEMTAMKESRAVIQAAQEALKAADEQVAAERARKERAEKRLKRMTSLSAQKAIPQSRMDDVRLEAETALIELRRQEFYRAAFKALMVAIRLGPQYIEQYLDRKKLEKKSLMHQLERARAALDAAEHDLALARIESPIDGVVLKKYDQGDSTLNAGKPLLLLGNTAEMEVVADVLTQDALRLKTGGKVIMDSASGRRKISGSVKTIEPAGFTKLSSLGVEQQRVKVIVSLKEQQKDLGVGYRLQARFITGSKENALTVPRFSVLQAQDRSYYVFTVQDGHLQRQPVKLGLQSDLTLEITEGLSETDTIVAKPDGSMTEGYDIDPVMHKEAEK
jgi:HlyD family secretion protein